MVIFCIEHRHVTTIYYLGCRHNSFKGYRQMKEQDASFSDFLSFCTCVCVLGGALITREMITNWLESQPTFFGGFWGRTAYKEVQQQMLIVNLFPSRYAQIHFIHAVYRFLKKISCPLCTQHFYHFCPASKAHDVLLLDRLTVFTPFTPIGNNALNDNFLKGGGERN